MVGERGGTERYGYATLVRFRNTTHGAQRDAMRRTCPAYDYGTFERTHVPLWTCFSFV